MASASEGSGVERESETNLVTTISGFACCSQVVLLDVVEDEGEGLSLFTVVLDGDGGGSLHLSGGTFLVVLAVSEPLTEVVSQLNFDKGDAVSLAEGLKQKHAVRARKKKQQHHVIGRRGGTYGNELLVFGVGAVVGEHGENSFLAVEALADLVESLDESYRQM